MFKLCYPGDLFKAEGTRSSASFLSLEPTGVPSRGTWWKDPIRRTWKGPPKTSESFHVWREGHDLDHVKVLGLEPLVLPSANPYATNRPPSGPNRDLGLPTAARLRRCQEHISIKIQVTLDNANISGNGWKAIGSHVSPNSH